jgi:methionyl-tRNA formyltransferase
LERGDDVVGVVAPPDDNIEAWYPSLVAHAKDNGLTVIQPRDINDPAVVSQLQEWAPDVIVMAGYSQILGEEVLSVPDIGVLNLHGGKLPEYRGASTLNWMIIENETEGGIAVLFADEGIDTGQIVLQEQFPITTEDTIVDVIEKTDRLFPEMLVTALDQIENESLNLTPQSPGEGCYYHSRRPQHGEIHWRDQTVKEVHNLVRALDGPYPSAFTHFEGDRLEIESTSLMDETVCGVPGRLCLRRSEGVVVVAQDRGLLVETVTLEGGETQDANSFFGSIGIDLG